MSFTKKEIKERYWAKKYREAPTIKCRCGCGKKMKAVDNYARPREYISGHNNRKYAHNNKYAYQKEWVKRNRPWANKRRRKISQKRKILFISQLGSKCSHCGLVYNGKNGAAFVFHHKDPTTKLFSISSSLTNKSLKALQQEIKKCTLICGNCHVIHHIGEY